jgi:hypothetical protein
MAVSTLASTAGADHHTRMMRATFKIAGESKTAEGSEESAAAFVVVSPRNAGTDATTRCAMITAAHFFDNVKGRRIDIVARRRRGENDFEKVRHPVPIRRDGKGLWVRYPDADVDVAALVLEWPAGLDCVPVDVEQLATTATLQSGAISPGRTVFALGYPFAIESSDAGFPVLRRGTIASFPPPTRRDQKTFLVDIAMSKGLSGAPVYLADAGDRQHGEAPNSLPCVVGMLVGQHELTSDFKGPFETRKVHHPLDLAIVVHAPAVRELLLSLSRQLDLTGTNP